VMCPHEAQRRAPMRMTPEEVSANLAAIRARYRPRRLEIVGGEPTRFPGFFDILAWLADEWPDLRVHVYTNGLRLADDAFAARAARFGVVWNVSVHAPDEETSHAITGCRERHARLLEALDRAAGQGLDLRASVAVVRQNEDRLPELGALLGRFTFARVFFRLPVLARADWERFMPDVTRFVERIERACERLPASMEAEIIMAPRCFGTRVPVNVEDGEVVLVDRACSAHSGGRLRGHYDNAIVNRHAQVAFRKTAECARCAFDQRCQGMDGRYIDELARAGMPLRPIAPIAAKP